MSIKRLIAFVIDFLIIELLTIVICIMLNIIISHLTRSDFNTTFNSTMFFVQIKILNIDLKIGMFFVVYIFLSIYILALYTISHKNLTIGDRIMRIKITSKKFRNFEFLLLRFLFRNFFFLYVFLFINIIYMIYKRNFNVVWYDSILGINAIDVKD